MTQMISNYLGINEYISFPFKNIYKDMSENKIYTSPYLKFKYEKGRLKKLAKRKRKNCKN